MSLTNLVVVGTVSSATTTIAHKDVLIALIEEGTVDWRYSVSCAKILVVSPLLKKVMLLLRRHLHGVH